MDTTPPGDSTNLSWVNVGLGLAFILFNALLSTTLNLGVGNALVTSAFRCIVQLAIMGLVLQRVFETNNPWAVGAIAFVLNFLGTFEAVANKSKKRYHNMFSSVLMSMLGSTIPVSIIGARYAMAVDPFWTPEQYIPMVGMLCGNTVSGVVVAVAYVLKEMYDNRDKVETYLAFGASRFEACLPIARDALRLALTPTINQMRLVFLVSPTRDDIVLILTRAYVLCSVIGIISIPGMMTGAILGGSSVEQAAKLQMIIMFMISASTALASIVTTVVTLSVVVDSEHRVRPDRVDVKEHAIWRARNWVFAQIVGGIMGVVGCCCRRQKEQHSNGRGEPLLG